MFFSWLKRRRRSRLRQQPFPDSWLQILESSVPFYARLTNDERTKLRRDLQVFIPEKNWEGCGGLALTDEIKVIIAAFACLTTLGFDEEYFDHVKSILVYPAAYIAQGRMMTDGGLVIEGDSHREGEAWYRGPVIVNWAETLACSGGEAAGRNVVVHEFAHQLDMQNGQMTDGTPPLSSQAEFDRWERVMQSEYEELVEKCAQGRPTLLNCYGATSIVEFFAVASETFFERPRGLMVRHPALYEILRDYYHQDPAQRIASQAGDN